MKRYPKWKQSKGDGARLFNCPSPSMRTQVAVEEWTARAAASVEDEELDVIWASRFMVDVVPVIAKWCEDLKREEARRSGNGLLFMDAATLACAAVILDIADQAPIKDDRKESMITGRYEFLAAIVMEASGCINQIGEVEVEDLPQRG